MRCVWVILAECGRGVKINGDHRKSKAACLENAAGGEMRSMAKGP